MKLTKDQIVSLAVKNGYEYEALKAVIDVESGGIGFAADGKIIIQFEPSWFKRKSPYTPSGLWSQNGVEKQSREWIAFNDAFAKNANAAMESTSIGLMQVMGFHWKMLGFTSVGAMWDFAKVSEANQLDIAIRFIKSNKKLDTALKTLDWATFAYYYNGSAYKKFKYDTRLATAYIKAGGKYSVLPGKLSSTDLNVRSGAGTNFEKITTIPKGTKVAVYSSGSGWSKISIVSNGIVGYVSSQYLI